MAITNTTKAKARRNRKAGEGDTATSEVNFPSNLEATNTMNTITATAASSAGVPAPVKGTTGSNFTTIKLPKDLLTRPAVPMLIKLLETAQVHTKPYMDSRRLFEKFVEMSLLTLRINQFEAVLEQVLPGGAGAVCLEPIPDQLANATKPATAPVAAAEQDSLAVPLEYGETTTSALGLLESELEPKREGMEQPESEQSNAALQLEYEATRLKFVMKYLELQREWDKVTEGLQTPGTMEALTAALAVLVHQARFNYFDIVGEVYMAWGSANKWHGQFFTPFPVAKAMARLNLANLKDWSPTEFEADGRPKPMKIYDPACGSGIMFLAAAEVIMEERAELLEQGLVKFYGQDIDANCVMMARLKLVQHKL